MRSWSFPCGRLFGIKLDIHVTFLLLLAYIAYEGWRYDGPSGALWGSVFLLLMFACVVFHELGHSLTARRFKIHVHRILLLPIGGMAQFARIPRQPSQELLITGAGPAVNFAIAFVLWPIVGGLPDLPRTGLPFSPEYLFDGLLIGNLVMGIFNLLPVFPMDGGRIFRAVLAMRLPYLRATWIAVSLGKTLAVIGALYMVFVVGSLLTALLFFFIYLGGDMEYKLVRQQEMFRGLRAGDIMTEIWPCMASTGSIGDAARLMRRHGPADVFVLENGLPVGVLLPDEIGRLAGAGRLDDLAMDHIHRDFVVAGPEWPVEILVSHGSNSPVRSLPVVSEGTLLGAIDLENLEENVKLARSLQTRRRA